MEEFAYEDALIHAAKFTQMELDEHARRDVLFASLCANPGNYRLELLRFEGFLRRLTRERVSEHMTKQGVNAVYEAWIMPVGEGTPLCVLFTELPPGLEPQKDVLKDRLDHPVAATGYFFKLLKYEQMGLDRNNPGKHKVWAAPVLIGKSLTVLKVEDLADESHSWRMTFLPVIVGGLTALALSIVYLSWRYRRGDRAILEQAREKRNLNPFEND